MIITSIVCVIHIKHISTQNAHALTRLHNIILKEASIVGQVMA